MRGSREGLVRESGGGCEGVGLQVVPARWGVRSGGIRSGLLGGAWMPRPRRLSRGRFAARMRPQHHLLERAYRINTRPSSLRSRSTASGPNISDASDRSPPAPGWGMGIDRGFDSGFDSSSNLGSTPDSRLARTLGGYPPAGACRGPPRTCPRRRRLRFAQRGPPAAPVGAVRSWPHQVHG